MTSQERLDSITALFQQAEAELGTLEPIDDLELYNAGLSQTELRSTTIKTVHAIHSVKQSMSINKLETKTKDEVQRSEAIVQHSDERTENSISLRKKISDLYELAMNDAQDSPDDTLTRRSNDTKLLDEKQTEIDAAMAEIAHTVKAIPTVHDQQAPPAGRIVNSDLKSQILEIVEATTREVLKNEMRIVLEDMLTKRLENKLNFPKRKTKKAKAKKTQAKKTQTKKTQAKKTQAKKTQTKKTQAKKTQAKKTQTKKTQTKKTQTKKTQTKKTQTKKTQTKKTQTKKG